MKRMVFTILCLVIAAETFAQQKNQNLNSMIAAEYNFAKSASEVGTHDAFLKFIADDGILFRPTPVNGKKFLNENNKPSNSLLSWYPAIAFVSRSGDLGFTTGPWEWRRSKTDSSALAFGNFCTVWQRQLNGEWKFVIDIGNRNDKPHAQPEALKVDTSKSNSSSLITGIKREKPDELIELDKQFTLIAYKMGVAATYGKFVNDKSRLLRDGSFPIIGTQQISEYFTQQLGSYNFKPVGGKISSSKDFGFTYGGLEITNQESKLSEQFNYMRIYKKNGKHWVIVVEVANKREK